jgi:hypothetical protein
VGEFARLHNTGNDDEKGQTRNKYMGYSVLVQWVSAADYKPNRSARVHSLMSGWEELENSPPDPQLIISYSQSREGGNRHDLSF